MKNLKNFNSFLRESYIFESDLDASKIDSSQWIPSYKKELDKLKKISQNPNLKSMQDEILGNEKMDKEDISNIASYVDVESIDDIYKNIIYWSNFLKDIKKSLEKGNSIKGISLDDFNNLPLDVTGENPQKLEEDFKNLGDWLPQAIGVAVGLYWQYGRYIKNKNKEETEASIRRIKDEASRKAHQDAAVISSSVSSSTSTGSNHKKADDTSANTPAEKLRRLKEILDLGLITKSEFDEKKKSIISSWSY